MKVKYLMIGVLATVLPVTSAMARFSYAQDAVSGTTASSPVSLSGVKIISPNALILTGSGFGPSTSVKVGSNQGTITSLGIKQMNVSFKKSIGSAGEGVTVSVSDTRIKKPLTISGTVK